ncbi:MAG TPA: hypothetical protein VFF17_00510 [Thermoanaerobaculia bacterium]|nr:hypothetical protein [Thermoanaerobaculia bacterium]
MATGANMPEDPARSPQQVRSHVVENLRFIRETMEAAGAFTAMSGRAQVVIGATALGAALLASRQPDGVRWLAVWLAEAVVAVAIATAGILEKSRRRRLPLLSGVSRRFWPSLAAPLFVGAALTVALATRGQFDVLPGVWLLLFGAAIVAGGALSVPLVRAMGWSFLALGLGALFAPPAWGDAFLAGGFGGLLAVFGVAIARRHGG